MHSQEEGPNCPITSIAHELAADPAQRSSPSSRPSSSQTENATARSMPQQQPQSEGHFKESLPTEQHRPHGDAPVSLYKFQDRDINVRITKLLLHCQPPRRFYYRTTVLVLVPLAIALYWIYIWRAILSRGGDTNLKVGTKQDLYVNYSWFIVGVFGLEWSRHGLVGIEAIMMDQSFWQARSLAGLQGHGDSSWSGPGGWLKLLPTCISSRSRHGRLWYLLAAMSFLPFVGLPLSGLSLELGDGYIPTNEMPKIIGRTFDNYQARQGFYMPDKLVLRWSSGSSAMLPGMGIIYTPEGVERDRYAGLSRLPNSLAMDTSLPEVFLGPQAEEPLVGRAWGMRAAYDCSVVTDVSEFAILNRRSQAKEDSPLNVISDRRQLRLGLSTGEEIHPILDRSSNLGSYAEMGLSFKHNKTAIPIYDGTEASSFDSAGLAKADIIEMALWQVRLEASDGDQVDFNEAAGPGIKGIGQAFVKAPDGSGLFVPNRTFFQMDNMNETKLLLEAIGLQSNHTDALEVFNSTFRITAAAAPIGVRCSSISTVGYAVLDTVRSAFHSFAGSPLPLPNESTEGAVPRLGVFAAKMLFGDGLSPGTSAAVRDALVARLLSAIGAPPPLAMSNSAQYGSFVQAGQLQSAAMTAYALDALELMYDTTYRFEQAQERPGLTGSEKGKVLTPGIVPPEIPAVFFGLWAVGSVALALAYGFRRRQSDALNGYSFFRLGVEKSGEVAEVFS